MKNLDVVVRVKREPSLAELRPVAEALTALIDKGLVEVLIVGGCTENAGVPHVSEFMLLGLCTADSAQPEVVHGNITVLQYALRQEVDSRA